MALPMAVSDGSIDGHNTDSSQYDGVGEPIDAPSPSQTEYWTSLIRQNLALVQDHDSVREHTPPNVDEAIMEAPRRRSARSHLAKDIATKLYPDLEGPLAAAIQYEKALVCLRSLVLEQRRRAIVKATERNERTSWIKRISEQGPWDEVNDPLSLDGAPSLPMPVEQSDKASLAPFFAHLCKGGKYRPDPNSKEGCAGVEAYYNVEFVEFEKGVLYSDGRVDLCKMVTGPRNIGDLMDSLKPSTFSKHFLLGNNIIGPIGIKAIAAFIDEFPDRFETWYLAGNCIDKESFSLLVASMVKSSCITNVWLKRNPLGPKAAADVFRLITESTSLRTLDLDQTELGDEGVAELFGLLSEHTPTEPLPLRHLYLNASGIGANGCKQIADYMRSPHCTIESLYMSLNPLGDAVIDLAAGLRYNSTLRRLVMQSCGIKDNGIIAIAAAFSGNVTIAALDVGQGYATADLGMRFNWIADDSAGAIVNLLHSTRLEYMNISYAPMSQQAMNSILAAMTDSEFAQWFFAKSLTTGGRDAASIKAGQEQARLSRLVRKRLHENVWAMYGVRYNEFESGEKRFLINPRDVRLIDSVYRNRDANAARRGLKHLDKWWNDDDETLARVQDGTL